MADNPRELIRAAQAAELQGDRDRAAECLEKAAALYQASGHGSRAAQLSRQARQLRSRAPDVSPAFAQAMAAGGRDATTFRSLSSLSWSEAASSAFNARADADGPATPSEPKRPSRPQEPVSPAGGRDEAFTGPGPWSLEPASGSFDALDSGGLPSPSERWSAPPPAALPRLAGRIAAIGAPAASAPTEPGSVQESASGADTRASGSARASVPGMDARAPAASGPGYAQASAPSVDGRSSRPSGSGYPASAHGMATSASGSPGTGFTEAQGAEDAIVPGGYLSPPEDDFTPGFDGGDFEAPSHPESDEATRPAATPLGTSEDGDAVMLGGLLRPPEAEEGPEPDLSARGRRRQKRLIERGPTRADPALDAWCSFCCRPRGEVGDLVAGPAGAFICKGCLGESQGLLGDVAPPPARKPVAEAPSTPGAMELVGHEEVRALLDRMLHLGARCLLVVGPEGCGKSVFLQSLQRRGQGVLARADALHATPGSEPLLVEDVDQLEPRAQAALLAFLEGHPERAVVLSARGEASSLGLWLRGEGGSLPVPTTASLLEAVRDSVPVALLEHVQALLPVRRPTVPELVEVARRLLALRQPTVTLSEEVLGAFAAEAVRSPRAGHELRALLARVYPGSWSLESAQTPTPAPLPPRNGRKGTP